MANSDKNILITPNVSAATGTYPNIKFNGANNTPITLSVLDDGTVSFSGTAGQLFSVSDGLSGTIFSVNDISGIPSIEVLDTGLVKLNQYNGSTVFGASAAIQNSSSVNAKVSISTASAATPGLIIKAVSSQTANLQEWQNSAGTVLAKVQSGGEISSLGFISTYNSYMYAGAADATPLRVIGTASQTANLQEWQNSGGTVLSKVDASGNITVGVINASTVNVTSQVVTTYEGRFGGAAALGVVTAGTWTTSIPLFVARASSGQTANLQEWQNSSGSVLTQITPNGSILINDAALRINVPSSYGSIRFQIGTDNTGVIGQVIRGVSGQTANLQEWQNSSGTVLTSVDKDGYLQTPRLVITNGGNIIDSAGTTPYFGFGSNQIAIYTRNAAYKGLVIQGSASQTAALQDWQNSAGTSLVSISAGGNLRVAGDNISVYRLQSVLDGNYVANFPGSGNIQLFIATDQTAGGSRVLGIANATTAPTSNPTGGGVLYVNSGALTYRGTSNAAQQIIGADGSVSFTAPTTTTVGLIVRGAASQTASLTEWQNSSGNTVSKVDASGSHWISAQPATSGTVEISSPYLYLTSNRWTGSASTGEVFGLNNFRFGGVGAENAFALHIKPSYSPSAYLSVAGDTSRSVGVNVQYPSASSGYGQFGVQIADASYKGIIVRGAASQTANLQEWQNSAGTVLASIGSAGFGLFSANVQINGDLRAGPNNLARITSISNSATKIGLVVQGAASQTADLTQWQDSAGSVMARVSFDGTFSWGSATSALQNSSGRLIINLGSAASVGITVKGAASQTANLQEWQNSAGTVMVKILSDGSQTWYNASNGTTIASISPYGEIFAQGNIYARSAANYGASLNITTPTTTYIGAVIRSISGQTANLTEWQNSSGTVLASVEPGGAFNILPTSTSNGYSLYVKGAGSSGIITIKSTATSAHAIQLQNSSNTIVFKMDPEGRIVPSSTSSVGLIVRGLASQTANLQEWQNSSGTVLAKVDKDGNFTANNITDTDWISVSSFSNGYSGYGSIAYRKLNGVVYLRGAVSGGTADTTAFNLPAGYRPSVDHVVPVQKYGTTDLNYVTIYTNGDVRPNSTAAWLSSVNYPA